MAFESLSDKLTAAFKRLRGKGRLTSASSSAMRTSRMASFTSEADSRPLPRRRLNAAFSLSDKLSNAMV